MRGRRRRSHAIAWLAAGAAVLVLGGAAATVALLRTSAEGDGDPAAAPLLPADPVPERRADQVTVDVDPVSGFAVTAAGTDAGRQFASISDLSTGGTHAGEVSAYDPGSFDSAPLKGGEAVALKGRDAWYVPDYTFAALSAQDEAHTGPAIGWQDASGVWLLAYPGPDGADGREALTRLAEATRLTPPRELRTPFRMGGGPGGLAVTYVRSDEVSDARGGAIGLSDPRRKSSAAAVYTGAPYGVSLAVTATVADAAWAKERATLSGSARVAGHPAWYSEGRSMLSPDGRGSTLIVETGPCVLRLRTADRQEIPRDQLTRTVEEMTVGDCDDPDTWITPLP